MKTRTKFKLKPGNNQFMQSDELYITGTGRLTYIWIGSKRCYATLSGMKTLETLASSIYRALGHTPCWLKEKKKPKRKTTRK